MDFIMSRMRSFDLMSKILYKTSNKNYVNIIIYQLKAEISYRLEGEWNNLFLAYALMRLTVIRTRSKQTISTRSGLEFLQMVSETNTRRCVSKDARCHSHACPRHVAHGRMPVTHRNLYLVLLYCFLLPLSCCIISFLFSLRVWRFSDIMAMSDRHEIP